MPVGRAGSSSPTRSSQPVQIRPGSRWRPSASLDQVRQGGALLKRNQAGESVRQVQQRLNAAGVQPPLAEDGYLGRGTESAVRRYQAQHGLGTDGIVGPETLRALEQGGTVENPGASRSRNARNTRVGNTNGLSGATDRAPTLGTETRSRRTGLLGLLSGGGRLNRSDIDWRHPTIRPPSGPVTRPSAQAFEAAVNAYEHAREKGQIRNPKMTLIDFSRPSTEARMWVIDMDSKKLLAQHRVAHGVNSGDPRDARRATRFSNEDDTHQSSLGTYITAETYHGNHGRSLKLDGKEPGFNSEARDRYIVMHEANYASDAFVRRNGYLGRSHGCPAMDPAVAQRVIDMVKNGSAMLIYSPDPSYLRRSEYIQD